MTNKHTTITAQSTREFLGLVPALLGFTPQHSLVLVPFEQTRSLGALRVDLEADPATLAGTTMGLLCRVPAATGVAAIIYTDDDAASTATLAAEIATRADHTGLHLVESLYVASDGYGSNRTGGEPRPLAEIVTPDPLREHVAASQASEATIPDADPDRAAAIAQALDSIEDGDLVAFVDVAEHAASTDPAELDAHRAAVMLSGLGSPLLRDVALIQWATDPENGERALHAQLAAAIGVPVSGDIARTLWGEGARPEAARLIGGLAIAQHLAPYGNDTQRPNLLAAAAWLSWALGRSTHAAIYADRALAIDPEHGMAQIVATIVSAGRLPDWAFAR